MEKRIQIVTIKPLSGEIEYGIMRAGQWLMHGLVFNLEVSATTTGEQIVSAATADAVGRGLI